MLHKVVLQSSQPICTIYHSTWQQEVKIYCAPSHSERELSWSMQMCITVDESAVSTTVVWQDCNSEREGRHKTLKRWSWCIDHQQVTQNSLFMFYYYRPSSIFPIQTSADTHCRTCCSYCTIAQPKLHFNCCRQRLLLEKSSEEQCISSSWVI